MTEIAQCARKNRSEGRKFRVMNDSSSRMEVSWVHPQTNEKIKMTDEAVVPGAEFAMDSFVGHEFELLEIPSVKTGVCSKAPNQECRKALVKVSTNDNQVAHLREDWSVEFVDNRVRARREAATLIADCRSVAAKKLEEAGENKDAAMLAMQELMACVEGGVTEQLERVHEEISFQASVRTGIAGLLENYTCADSALESSADVETTTWQPPLRITGESGDFSNNAPLTVHVKLNRPASRIHVIDNFIRDDECQAMEEQAASKLHRATVADGKGGHRVSESRKAMQAGILVPWKDEGDDHPIARVSRRVYDYVNHVLGLDIRENGQEDLMSIQYFGKGVNSTEPPDRYMPHCDGDCNGQRHKFGQRMATMVMYCTTAELGGHTNFRNAGVHVKPEKYAGIFFSYIDPDAMTMDNGFTEHSGCPVIEGEKKIVTQWIRYGVDDENTWDSFNTLGIKKAEIEKLEHEEL
jgi:hypothetical protein